MSTFAPPQTQLVSSAVRKVSKRLIPLLCLMFFFAMLDRVNISFAGAQMREDLSLTATAFGHGAGLFFLGYFFFEVPSNLYLQKIGARKTLARVMIFFGAVTIAFAFVHDDFWFFALRFLLGVAEAGFLPGVIFYLTKWAPVQARAKLFGMFVVAIPVSTALGAPICTAILKSMQGVLGLAAWEWIFILCGVPTILLGILVLFVLPENPMSAKFLTQDERLALTSAVKQDDDARSHHLPAGWFKAVANFRIMRVLIVYTGIVFGIYGTGFWLPQIFGQLGLDATAISYAVAVPYLLAAALMVLWASHSDRKKERMWHLAVPAWISAAGFFTAFLMAGSPLMVVLALGMSVIGIFCALPIYWTFPSMFFTGATGAFGIAAINSLGNLAGYVAPTIMGAVYDATKSFGIGFTVVGAVMAITGVMAFFMKKDFAIEKARAAENDEPAMKPVP